MSTAGGSGPPPWPSVPIDPGANPSERLAGHKVELTAEALAALKGACATVSTSPADLLAASRDWWPLSLVWATHGEVPALPAAVATPAGPAETSAVAAACNRFGLPLTTAGGRSGVLGGSVPVHGGVSLSTTAMAGVLELDERSLLVRVAAGTRGDVLEAELAGHGLTLGHWPQSIDISTVGGWLACRSAGQASTRYGKIEDMVAGLEVVLADGSIVETGGRAPREAAGPDLGQVFLGSEGTLGVITSAWLRVAPAAEAREMRAYGFASFEEGLDACRSVLRRGATPAVMRLYDEVEASRSFGQQTPVLLCFDEGDPIAVDAAMAVVAECSAGAAPLDRRLVEDWLATRNDVSMLGPLVAGGLVVDTVEVAARWSVLPELYRSALALLRAVPGTIAASAHQSHAYPDGACLYFTFAGQPPAGTGTVAAGRTGAEGYYLAAWESVMTAAVGAGAAISHHHGIGLNRSRFLAGSLGSSGPVLRVLKDALDPRGIMNPGKLGLESPFGPVPWP
ncbi:MAG: FAD-binding oxidoreductase [Acidimicrobiales bacterium]